MWQGFNIGESFHISSFGLMMFLAFLSCNLLIRKTLKEKNINPMIGDDIINDVGGAQSAGIKGVLVKTGKYRKDLWHRS